MELSVLAYACERAYFLQRNINTTEDDAFERAIRGHRLKQLINQNVYILWRFIA